MGTSSRNHFEMKKGLRTLRKPLICMVGLE